MRRRPTIPLLVALLLGLLLAPRAASAQTAQEPLLIPTDDSVLSYSGRVPFRSGDEPRWATRSLDDTTWGSMRVPAYWQADRIERDGEVGWYRVHVRLAAGPVDGLALLLPPTASAYEVWLDSVRIDASGTIGGGLAGGADETHRLVHLPRDLLRRGDNVVAVRVAAADGLAGMLGPLRLGTERAVSRAEGRRDLATGGFLVLFAVLTLFHLVMYLVSPSDRRALLFGLTLAAVTVYSLANNDHWYYFFDSTEWKLRARYVGRFALHAFGVLLLAESIAAEVSRPTRFLAVVSGLGALASVLAPISAAFDLNALSWLLTIGCLLFGIDLAQGLPRTFPLIASGVRAGMVGAMLAVFYEVLTGSFELPGVGPAELGSLPLAIALIGTLALGAGLAQLRAARVVSASRDGMVVLRQGGGVELSNPAMQQLLGRSVQVLREQGLEDSLSEEGWAELEAAVERLRAGGPEAQPEVFDLLVEGPGRTSAVEVVGVQLDGERTLLSFRDVTRRQELEREVARGQRLDSLGMLAGGIAHDFNNLLAGILASASELDPDSGIGDRDRRRRLATIIEAARRGGALTQRLLQFARGRAENPLGVDLEHAVPDLVDMLGRTLGRNIEWHLDLEHDLPTVGIDETELEQLLVNLCVNARDAMAPRGGVIDISARLVAGPGEEEHSVALTVRDEGPGIPSELLDKVFEPFVTTKGSGAGTGLGLAVVYGIVRGREGDVLIDSRPGEGTSFTLLLPVHDATASDSLPSGGVQVEPAPGMRVLLVDDEPALRTFLSRALERRGMEVRTLVDGQAAMDWIGEQSGDEPPVDAVVMDMMMPVIDGLEATTALRERWPGLPVVISSGYTGRESIAPLQRTGPTILLAKPYQVDDLVAALGRVTAGS